MQRACRLEKVFGETFRRAKIQRCQFHRAGNVLAKVRKKDRQAVKKDLHQVFYTGSRLGAKRGLEQLAAKWKAIYPDAVRCVEKDFDALIRVLKR